MREDEKIFAALRGHNVRNEAGKWEFPGGHVEFGEKLSSALVREVFEEYNLKIEVTKFLGVLDHILPDEKQHWISTQFLARWISGVMLIKETSKCEAIGWFSLEELLAKDLTKPTRALLENYMTGQDN